MITSSKDTEFLVLNNLKDRDLFNYCLANKAASSICNNEDFWRNRYHSVYGETGVTPSSTWKKLYLSTYFLVIDITDDIYDRFNPLQNREYFRTENSNIEEIEMKTYKGKNIIKAMIDNIFPRKIKRAFPLHGENYLQNNQEKLRELNRYMELRNGKWTDISLIEAEKIWQYEPDFIFVPSLRVAGYKDELRKYFVKIGNPEANINAHLEQNYSKNMTEYMRKMYEQEDKEVKDIETIKVNPICAIVQENVYMFDEKLSLKILSKLTVKDDYSCLWIFRIDNKEQEKYVIETYLEYGNFLKWDEIKGDIKDIPTDDLQIKRISLEKYDELSED